MAFHNNRGEKDIPKLAIWEVNKKRALQAQVENKIYVVPIGRWTSLFAGTLAPFPTSRLFNSYWFNRFNHIFPQFSNWSRRGPLWHWSVVVENNFFGIYNKRKDKRLACISVYRSTQKSSPCRNDRFLHQLRRYTYRSNKGRMRQRRRLAFMLLVHGTGVVNSFQNPRWNVFKYSTSMGVPFALCRLGIFDIESYYISEVRRWAGHIARVSMSAYWKMWHNPLASSPSESNPCWLLRNYTRIYPA